MHKCWHESVWKQKNETPFLQNSDFYHINTVGRRCENVCRVFSTHTSQSAMAIGFDTSSLIDRRRPGVSSANCTLVGLQQMATSQYKSRIFLPLQCFFFLVCNKQTGQICICFLSPRQSRFAAGLKGEKENGPGQGLKFSGQQSTMKKRHYKRFYK